MATAPIIYRFTIEELSIAIHICIAEGWRLFMGVIAKRAAEPHSIWRNIQ